MVSPREPLAPLSSWTIRDAPHICVLILATADNMFSQLPVSTVDAEVGPTNNRIQGTGRGDEEKGIEARVTYTHVLVADHRASRVRIFTEDYRDTGAGSNDIALDACWKEQEHGESPAQASEHEAPLWRFQEPRETRHKSSSKNAPIIERISSLRCRKEENGSLQRPRNGETDFKPLVTRLHTNRCTKKCIATTS